MDESCEEVLEGTEKFVYLHSRSTETVSEVGLGKEGGVGLVRRCDMV